MSAEYEDTRWNLEKAEAFQSEGAGAAAGTSTWQELYGKVELNIPTWARIRPGDVLHHYDPTGTEIVAVETIESIERVPYKDIQNVRVTSTILESDGGSVTINTRVRTDKELAGPNIIKVYQTIESAKTHSADEDLSLATTRLTSPGILHDLMDSLGRLRRMMEEDIAAKVCEVSDYLTKLGTMNSRTGEYKQFGELSKEDRIFESLLHEQKEFHDRFSHVIQWIEQLSASAFIGMAHADHKSKPLLLIEEKVKEGLQTGSFDTGLLTEISKLALRFSTVREDSPEYSLTMLALRNLSATGHLLEEKLSRIAIPTGKGWHFTDDGDLMHGYTTLERAETVTNETLHQVSKLIEAARRTVEGTKGTADGIVIDDYYDPSYLREMLESGAHIITHREEAYIDNPEGIVTGVIFYYPDEVPDTAKGIEPALRVRHDTACVDILCVSPHAERGTAQKLLNAHTAYLQPTDKRYSSGVVWCHNERSFRALTHFNHVPDLTFRAWSSTPERDQTRWLPLKLPLHPRDRAVMMTAGSNTGQLFQNGFNAQTSKWNDRITNHARRVAKLEGIAATDCITRLRRTIGAPTFTRISLGAGNMSPKEFSQIRGILEEGCKGIDGMVTWGSTVMLTLIDEQVTPSERDGAQRSLRTIRENASPTAGFIGVNVYDPDLITEERVIPGYNNDKPVTVIEDRPGEITYLTIVDPDVPNQLLFAGDPDQPDRFWDEEQLKSWKYGRRFQERGGRQGESVSLIGIFGAGGGTMGREIQDLAQMAKENPGDDIVIILIDGRNKDSVDTRADSEKSSTERYIDSEEFRKEHNRYVYVVDSEEELDGLLCALGAKSKPYLSQRDMRKDFGRVQYDQQALLATVDE